MALQKTITINPIQIDEELCEELTLYNWLGADRYITKKPVIIENAYIKCTHLDVREENTIAYFSAINNKDEEICSLQEVVFYHNKEDNIYKQAYNAAKGELFYLGAKNV